MAVFNLQSYRDRFPEAAQAAFGRSYNFGALEKDYAYLRRESNWLSVGHVLSLFDLSRTPYARYWPRPDEKQLDEVLKRERLRLAPLGGSGRNLAQRLVEILRNLGLASLILRLTYPERFATFSVAVATLLQVQRSNTVELYMAFCGELREWQSHFRMSSVAETEMALWTYYQIAAAAPQNGAGEEARKSFDADLWVQRRRLGQVLRPFIRKYGPLELARLLAEEDPRLAGKIAGEEHERLLRCAARRFYPHFTVGQKGWADALISLLAQDNLISLEEQTTLRRVWRLRNQAVHPDGHLALEDVENMIDSIERICQRWVERPDEA